MTLKKHTYFLDTGLTSYSDKKKYSSDKEAWNGLAKPFDAQYKTGGSVVANLMKCDMPILVIHNDLNKNKSFKTATIPIAIGYISQDWDGNLWNNPTFCKLCNCPIGSQRFRHIGYCKFCEQLVDSIFAWDKNQKRVPGKITQTHLDRLKELSPGFRYKTAMFLINDKTLKLIKNIED